MNDSSQSLYLYKEILLSQRSKIIENIKILVYKENQILFELLDYDNDRLFNEPFLFAYFYSFGKGATLEQLLLGHIESYKRPKNIPVLIDENGLIYLPGIGWLKTHLRNELVVLNRANKSIKEFQLSYNTTEIAFTFESLLKINNTSFEIINHQHPLLSPHYFDSKQRPLNVEIENITGVQKENLIKAFSLIREFVPEYYSLLEEAIFKVVIFNDPSVKRNSFATLSVHGCAFFNAFQREYDEIFFVEDIAHQCGHVIFNNMIHLRTDIFRISSETIIKETGLIGKIINLIETRTLFVIFHALFTYYGITLCLQACLLKAKLTPLQKHEALGRLAFCFRKFSNDLNLLGKVDKEGKNLYFTEAGLELYEPMAELFTKTKNGWGEKLNKINLRNQPYNFSSKNFHKANPL